MMEYSLTIAAITIFIVLNTPIIQTTGALVTNRIDLTATMKPSGSFSSGELSVKHFEFSTTDRSICPALPFNERLLCTYTIENSVFRNFPTPDAYVLKGNILITVVDFQGHLPPTSKNVPIRIDLEKVSTRTMNGKTTELLSGSIDFGTNVLAPNFEYKVTNATLEGRGTDNLALKLQATNVS